jgi:hypothetical protein
MFACSSKDDLVIVTDPHTPTPPHPLSTSLLVNWLGTKPTLGIADILPICMASIVGARRMLRCATETAWRHGFEDARYGLPEEELARLLPAHLEEE